MRLNPIFPLTFKGHGPFHADRKEHAYAGHSPVGGMFTKEKVVPEQPNETSTTIDFKA